MNDRRLVLIVGMILAAAFFRLAPHPPNFAPVAAMALFAGAHLADKRLAFLVPLLAMFLSDLFLGFHDGMLLVYLCMCISVAIGMQLHHRIRFTTVAAGTLASSVIFFLLTNFGVWVSGFIYPLTSEGLVACYVAAMPFFQHTLLGDGVFALVLFGGFALLQRWTPDRTSSAAGTA